MELDTIPKCYQYVRDTYANSHALNFQDEQGWHALSTKEFSEEVELIGLGLVSLGLKKGDKIGVHGLPSPYWTLVDMAIMCIGCVSVPLFANISEENYAYECGFSEMKAIFADGEVQWNTYRKHKYLMQHAIEMAPQASAAETGVIAYHQMLDLGRKLRQQQPDLFNQLANSVQPNDLASIIFTSGSTGMPKGVELTHLNFTCLNEFNGFHWTEKDRYLSILPLAHVLGHCVNLWALIWGISIYYTNDYKNLSVACKQVKPTITVVVPRLLEKIYLKILEQIEHSSFLKRKLGIWAVNLAKHPPSFYKSIFHPIANLLVFRKFKQALGGHLRVVLSGGAHLNPKLHQFFDSVGIHIYEGWGLTEACPVCVNLPEKNKVGTVGPPLMGHQLSITSEGEVLVKGPLVMKGYYKQPEVTAQTVDREGWLHTGDRGKIDEDGYLTIIGRMKELYKTSTGEYVAPVPIEQALARCPFLEMSMVVAEGRKYTTCLLFPNFELIKKMKWRRKLDHLSDQEFLNSPAIRKEMQKLLDEINVHLNQWEQVHDYRFVMEPLTIENGDLTPSMKIRREVVAKKYETLINSMYTEEDAKWIELQ